MRKLSNKACGTLVRKYARRMLEGIAYTQRTGKEMGFCAHGRRIVRNCYGTDCEVSFEKVPLRKMPGAFCFHTHPDPYYPRPSTDDLDFFDYAHFGSVCVSNVKGKTLCMRADQFGAIRLPKRGRRCERTLKTFPGRKRGYYLRLSPKRIKELIG